MSTYIRTLKIPHKCGKLSAKLTFMLYERVPFFRFSFVKSIFPQEFYYLRIN